MAGARPLLMARPCRGRLYPAGDLGLLSATLLDGYCKLGNPSATTRHAPGAGRRFQLRLDRPCAVAGSHGARRPHPERNFASMRCSGDGEMQEGQVGRRRSPLAHHKARNLVRSSTATATSSRQDRRVMGIEPLADNGDRSAGGPRGRRPRRRGARHPAARIKADLCASAGCVIAHTSGQGRVVHGERAGWHLGWLAPEDEARVLEEIMGGAGMSRPLSRRAGSTVSSIRGRATLSTLSDTLIELAEQGIRVSPALRPAVSNGLIGFARAYPERLISSASPSRTW